MRRTVSVDLFLQVLHMTTVIKKASNTTTAITPPRIARVMLMGFGSGSSGGAGGAGGAGGGLVASAISCIK
jgi:hypothetical protein